METFLQNQIGFENREKKRRTTGLTNPDPLTLDPSKQHSPWWGSWRRSALLGAWWWGACGRRGRVCARSWPGGPWRYPPGPVPRTWSGPVLSSWSAMTGPPGQVNTDEVMKEHLFIKHPTAKDIIGWKSYHCGTSHVKQFISPKCSRMFFEGVQL